MHWKVKLKKSLKMEAGGGGVKERKEKNCWFKGFKTK